MMSIKHRRDGFTLIEVLIVLVVMAGIAAFLTTGNQSLRSAAMEREVIHGIQSAVSSAQVEARKHEASVVVVLMNQHYAWVERDGVIIKPYYETFPASVNLSWASGQVYSDGTIEANLSTTLTTPEVTYALTIDRSGTVRVQ